MKYLFYLILIPMLLTAQAPSTFDTVKVNKFITPTKHDHFLYGHETEVKWQKLPDYDRYKLSFSPDGNRWWLTSDNIIGNTYQWEVSDMNCDSCQWKVEPYMDEDTSFLKHEWTRTSDPVMKHIEPIDLVNSNDSNMVLVGYKRVYSKNTERDQTDFYVAKYTSETELIWDFEYGDLDSNDNAGGILETENGDFIVVGTTESTDQGVKLFGKKDIVAIKLDKDGNKIWRRTYGGKDNDWGMKILQAKDGGYYIGGMTGSSDRYFSNNAGWVDYFIMKIDSEGYMEWSETYGREKDELLDDMQFDPDGNIILFGFSNSRDSVPMYNDYGTWTDKEHPWFVKVDSFGTKIWDYQHAIGDDYGGKFNVLNDGSVLAVFHSSDWSDGWPNQDPHTYWALKIDKNHNLQYVEEYLDANLWSYYKQFINSRGNITDLSQSGIQEIDTSARIIWGKKLNEGVYIPKSVIETKDHSLVIVGKNKPGELTFQKYTVLPLAVPEYSNFFSVETSKPTFTKDTVWFPTRYKNVSLDTTLKDIICNMGSIDGLLSNYKLTVLGNDKVRVTDIIYEDNYLNSGECADIRIKDYTSEPGWSESNIYFTSPYQSNKKNGHQLTLISYLTVVAIYLDKKSIDFGEVEIGDTSTTVSVEFTNISNRTIGLSRFGSLEEEFIRNTNSFEIEQFSKKSIELSFSPSDTGEINSVIRFIFIPEGNSNDVYVEIYLKGTGIPKKETSVNESKGQTQTTYPNPATNKVNLSGYTEESIYIYDITGKQVIVAAVESERINITDLTAGVYFLKDGNGEVVGKFVKE